MTTAHELDRYLFHQPRKKLSGKADLGENSDNNGSSFLAQGLQF